MFRTTTVAIVCAAALSATPALAQAMTGKTYVMKAGASDLYEKQSSMLVMGSTKDPKIKQFAQKMIADHTDSTNQVKMAAKQAHMTVMPPKLDAEQASNMAKLRAAHGSNRDMMYVDQQKMSHQMALQVQQDYASNGTVAPLKTVATNIVPVVQGHIDMLNNMGTMGTM